MLTNVKNAIKKLPRLEECVLKSYQIILFWC
jgi:hypothetical protein